MNSKTFYSNHSVQRNFSHFFRKNSSFIKIWQEQRILYMETNLYLWQYLAYIFLEWEIFQTKVADKTRTHILYSIHYFRKSCRLWDNGGKCWRASCSSTAKIVTRIRHNVFVNTYIACLVSFGRLLSNTTRVKSHCPSLDQSDPL